MKKILAVYDIDQAYGERLADYLNRSGKVPFYMVSFTNRDALIEYGKKQKITILLINQSAMCEEIEDLNLEKVLFLTDVEGLTQVDNHNAIYKYQSTEYVVKELMNCYEALKPPESSDFNAENPVRVIGVYSPVKRCGKTSFGLTLGQMLSQKKHVLFLSLEEFSGFENLTEHRYFHDLSDAVFYCTQHHLSDKFLDLIQGYNDMDFIAPLHYPSDKKEIGIEELLGFMQEAVECGKYEVLILDVADGFHCLESVLNICDKIYMPVLDDPFSQAKLDEYEQFMKTTGKQEILEKTEKLHLPSYRRNAAAEETYLEQLLWGEMGDYIRRRKGGEW